MSSEPSPVKERLRRLLFLVPFVSRNQGQSVDEVARALGLSREALLEDLDLLTLVGRPPFQPDDFLDIYVEDDRVYVDVDQRLSAPPRLTAAEGVALAAAAALLKSRGSETLTSAVEKLERVLPAQAVSRFKELGRHLDVAADAPGGLGPLSLAIAEHRVVTFDYLTSTTGQREHRRVRPVELFSHHGQWYLSGHDEGRAGDRLFRLDRMGPLTVTDARFTPEASPTKVSLPGLDQAAQRVTVRFAPVAAPYVRERFGRDARGVGDGFVEVEVPGDNPRWLSRWVLSFGGEAVVVSPEWAVASVAEAAAASLE